MNCVVNKGTVVGIATKSDLADMQYGRFWITKVFTRKEQVKTFYNQDGILRWVMRLNNLFLIIPEPQIEWLSA
jgi:hypothetical protein